MGDPDLWGAPVPYQSQLTPHACSDPPQSASLLMSGLSALLLLLDAVAGCCTVAQPRSK